MKSEWTYGEFKGQWLWIRDIYFTDGSRTTALANENREAYLLEGGNDVWETREYFPKGTLTRDWGDVRILGGWYDRPSILGAENAAKWVKEGQG